jgi:signal transduction histidine kinase
MMIRIQSLIARSTRALSSKVAVYIFDVTPGVDAQSQFLEAAKVITPATPLPSIQPSNWELKSKEGIPSRLKFLDDYHLANLCHKHCRALQHTIDVVNRNWRIGVVALDESFEPTLSFVILGGVIIFLACVLIGIWVRQNALRVAKLNELRAKAESEKAALAIEAEHRRVECELNDYMAHEIRNPIAAALSACTFVKSAVNEVTPLVDEESRNSVREDVAIVDNSLHFVNDLLRNMLDMHRASDNQLKVDLSQTDIMKHVFESVDAMLYRRGSKIKVILECPENLVVVSDHLRLKQITLNLGRNSAKFMSQGFIRLRAEVVEGNVRLSVSDSGCGISVKKRELLFQKFQESLDSLSQGTVGLCKLYWCPYLFSPKSSFSVW